jgi:hypothetical protein
MPQAASVNNDHANELQQTGQKFHCAQTNKRDATGQPSIFAAICRRADSGRTLSALAA